MNRPPIPHAIIGTHHRRYISALLPAFAAVSAAVLAIAALPPTIKIKSSATAAIIIPKKVTTAQIKSETTAIESAF